MRTVGPLILLTACLFTAPVTAQLMQTDEFDYWEDQSSHSFTAAGSWSQGAYTCGNDLTLRCGNCSNGIGAASVVLAVAPGSDTVLLTFLVGWSGGNSTLWVDNVYMGLFGISGSCAWDSVLIPNATALTADSAITVFVRDTILGCPGDIQLARVRAYSSPGTPTAIRPHLAAHEDWSLYPNPAAACFFIETNTSIPYGSRFAILDAMGQAVFETTTNHSSGKALLIRPDKMPAGIYFVLIYSNEAIFKKKLLWSGDQESN